SPEHVELHLDALVPAFDAARSVIKTPFPFASDISELARPIAIDGSREMIARGDHGEAVFWLVATYSRCQKVLYQEAPAELRERFTPGYQALLADLGKRSFHDLQQGGEQIRGMLPRVAEVAEEIMAANPGIVD